MSWLIAFSRAATVFSSRSPSIVFELPSFFCVGELSAVAMRRMRGAAIVVTAMAIGRALVASLRFAFIRTILASWFCFTGTSAVPAFHAFHLELNCVQRLSAEEAAKSLPFRDFTFQFDSGLRRVLNPSHLTPECIRMVPSRTNSFFSMSGKFYRAVSSGDNSPSPEDHDD